MGRYTTFLYPIPTFAEGVGRILDFGDTLSRYNRSATPELADRRAFEADWAAIADDLRVAAKAVGVEQVAKKTTSGSP